MLIYCNRGMSSAAATAAAIDTKVAGLRRAIQERQELRDEYYKQAQTSVGDNPYLKAVIDAHDMSFTDKFITKKKQQVALQTLLQDLMQNLPPNETEYDRQLILAELQMLKNSRI